MIPYHRSGSAVAVRTVALGLVSAAIAMTALGCGSVPGLDRLASGVGGLFGSNDSTPQDSPTAPGAGESDAAARTIEEADIVKVVDNLVYVLNRFRGLVIIDVSDPDVPTILGSLELRGRGVEMYVVGPRAFVILSSDMYYPVYADGGPPLGSARMNASASSGTIGSMPMPPQPDYPGSQLAIVDVSDPAAPTLEDKINLAGFANASRRVGNVIYVIGNNYSPYGGVPESADANAGFVASVNVADPTNAVPVQRKTFGGSAVIMHVSEQAIFAASPNWDSDLGGPVTDIQYIDISDPGGAVTLRGTATVPGSIRNRFYLDDFAGVLRVAAEKGGFGFQEVRLFTFDLSNPDNIQPLGSVGVIRDETLQAVRFDGPRGYVVTFMRVDPLFVLDLSNPADPKVTGHLEVPGFSTHIEPRGNRLIAVGVDDTDGRRPAVAYYDVQDPANPAELGRVVLGPPGSFTESDATYDEKAFKIVDELGLIAIPFRHVEYLPMPATAPSILPGGMNSIWGGPHVPPQINCVNGVQLVDFSDKALTQRGWFAHRGRVERVGIVGARLFALSQAAFQTVNIDDRDNPQKAGQANFFPASDMDFYADDCGDYYGPINPPGPPIDGLPFLIQILVDGRLCGTISILPLIMMGPAIGLMRLGFRRRRRAG